MVEVEHLLDLAALSRNIAATTRTEGAQAELLSAAPEYERRAEVKRSSGFAVSAALKTT